MLPRVGQACRTARLLLAPVKYLDRFACYDTNSLGLRISLLGIAACLPACLSAWLLATSEIIPHLSATARALCRKVE